MPSTALLVFIEDPATRKIAGTTTIIAGQSIWELIEKGWIDVETEPVLLVKGDRVLLECEFDEILEAGEVLTIAPATGWIWIAAIVVSAISIGVSVYAYMQKPPEPASISRSTLAKDPGYRGNRTRPGEPLPCIYGEFETFPDAVGSWPEWQEIHQLFEVTVGECEPITAADIAYGDTPLTNFNKFSVEHINPGQVSQQFTQQAVYSDTVQDIDFNDAGPTIAHVINATGPLVNRLGCRITAPAGAYIINHKGSLFPTGVDWLAQYRVYGSDTGWTDFDETPRRVEVTTEPKKWEVYADVPHGRYEVRLQRSVDSRGTIDSVDKLVWNYARGWYTYDQITETTRVAIRLEIDSSVTSPVLSKVRIKARRKLPIWDGSSWSAPTHTRKAVWAIADALRASYGAGLPDARIDLAQLLALSSETPDEFNGLFNARATLWETLETLARPILCRPIELPEGIYSLVKDEANQMPVAMFGMRNIVDGSFAIQNSAFTDDTPDAIRVVFVDENEGYRENAVTCIPAGSPANNVEEFEVPGVTNVDAAYEVGIRYANELRWRRKQISFETGIEGYVPIFGEVIRVHHHLLALEQDENTWSGEIKSLNGADFNVYEDLSNLVGDGNLELFLRNLDGTPQGPLACTVVDHNTVRIDEPYDSSMMVFGDDHAGPLFEIVKSDNLYAEMKVFGVQDTGSGTIRVEGVYDDQNVYIKGDTPVLPPLRERYDTKPSITRLFYSLLGERANVRAQLWWIAEFADYFQVEASPDYVEWQTYPRVYAENYTLILPETDDDTVYIRVYPVSALIGEPAELIIDVEGYQQAMWPIQNLRAAYPFDGDSAAVQWDPIPDDHYIAMTVEYTKDNGGDLITGGVFLLPGTMQWQTTYRYILSLDTEMHYGLVFPSHGARRQTIRLRGVLFDQNAFGPESVIIVENDQIGPLNEVTWSQAGTNLVISFQWPDTDYRGVLVWLSTQSGFAPSNATLVHHGDSNDIVVQGVLETPGQTYYVKMAAYDIWGVDDLHVSDQVAVVAGAEGSGEIRWSDIIDDGGKPDDNADVTRDRLPGDGVNRIPAQYHTFHFAEGMTHSYVSGANSDNYAIVSSDGNFGLFGEEAMKVNNAYPSSGSPGGVEFALAEEADRYNIPLEGGDRYIIGLYSTGQSGNPAGECDSRISLVSSDNVRYNPSNIQNIGSNGYIKVPNSQGSPWRWHVGVFDFTGLSGPLTFQLRLSLEESTGNIIYFDGIQLERLPPDSTAIPSPGLAEVSPFRGVGASAIKTRQLAPGAVTGSQVVYVGSDRPYTYLDWETIGPLNVYWVKEAKIRMTCRMIIGPGYDADIAAVCRFYVDNVVQNDDSWKLTYVGTSVDGIFDFMYEFDATADQATPISAHCEVLMSANTNIRGESEFRWEELRR